MNRGAAIAVLLVAASAPVAAQAPPGRGAALDQRPYWPGYWVSDSAAPTPISGIPDRASAPDGAVRDSLGMWAQNIPWSEEGKRRMAQAQASQVGRKALGWGYPTMMSASTPLQFLITPEEVLIINAYDEARHVYTDGRSHPPVEDLWPTKTGNSIGHWEGDTLVIDTIMVTNPNAFFQGAPPLSEQAHYVERIRLAGDRLTDDVTIEDPVTLSKPWVAHIGWVRDTGFDRMIQVDWSNDRTGRGEDGVNTIEPPADEKGN